MLGNAQAKVRGRKRTRMHVSAMLHGCGVYVCARLSANVCVRAYIEECACLSVSARVCMHASVSMCQRTFGASANMLARV